MIDKNKFRERLISIRKECFWDYKITPEKIVEMTKSKKKYIRNFVIEKILENSTNLLLDLKMLFSTKDIESFLDTYRIPRFKQEFLHKRKKIVEYVLLNKKRRIKEFEWRK